MNFKYQHIESQLRGYDGVIIEEDACKNYLAGAVKGNLTDLEQRESLLEALESLKTDTGFDSEGLLVDIQALENPEVDVPEWRIGEAMAEAFLEQDMQCRFHWNELRDARNPKGNKTGADLVGFIEMDGQVLFLFGEVKTSSETANRPPQVMTNSTGIESQLKDLYNDRAKRLILISYLQSKAVLYPAGHAFKEDFKQALNIYFNAAGDAPYKLIGILVRDVEPDENDVSESYHKLKALIPAPLALRLMALYMPIAKEKWLDIVTEKQ
ncbi:hypothetical protein [Mucilaginibacter sp.]|jgi:hypothetical protein|uniref:hypothetical protein n=1 Tax=Mucilaginibacter sp. TaxID=1882438 RepID=UPI002BCD59BD|nr:hypothetical protein [Mucilaginibacter sp.]HTI60102.1 hypothetical protein [Mucilaginibacter sp.]